MKYLFAKFVVTLVISTHCFITVSAQDNITITPDSAAASGLDLYAVAELFKDSENLEKFEQSLNDPKNGINNLDLNENGEVDFIRVTEKMSGDTHLIILQTPLGENEFQDVATIAVERESGDKYNLQIQGDTVLYGANYYVIPANRNFNLWNVVSWIFRPDYRVYVSPFYYKNLPVWWAVRRPVTPSVYRSRTGLFVGRKNFIGTRTVTVRTIHKVNYRPLISTLVIKKTKVIKTTTVKAGNGSSKTTTTKTKVIKGKKH